MGNNLKNKTEDMFQNIRLIELKKDFPMIPEEFINKEPCLDDLGQFVEECAELLKDRDDLKVGLKGYTSDSKESWAKGSYYLLGQLKLLPSERLSNTILSKAVDMDEQRLKDYGGPAHQMEYWSMQKHDTWFKSIKNLIAMYYYVKTEEYYAPGGQGYIEAKQRFEKNNI